MRNKQVVFKLLIAVVFAIVGTGVFSTEALPINGMSDGGTRQSYGTIQLNSPNAVTTNALKKAGEIARRVAILSYTLKYYSKPSADDRKDDDKVDLRPRFGLKEISGFMPEDFKAFTIVVDKNGNGKVDEGENDTIGGSARLEEVQVNKETGELVEATIVFKEMNRLEYEKPAHLILVADLINLKEKKSFVIFIDPYQDSHVEYVLPSGEKDLNIWGGVSAQHYVGNKPPELQSYGASVSSDYKNMEGSTFTFEVRFKDSDGDGPSEIYLHLDAGDGYKKYQMKNSNKSGENDWLRGETYTTSMKLMFNPSGIKYKFSASDGELSAEGEPTKEQKIAVMPWILTDKKYVFIENTQVLPGQKVKIKASFIANVDAKVEWKHSEGKMYDDYTVAKIIEGTPEPIRGIAGFMIHPIALYIVPKVGFGKKSISSIEFPYSVNKEEEGATHTFSYKSILQMPDVELEVTPAIATVKISQKEVMLGDKVKYALNLSVFGGAIVEQRVTVPTEPFRKIGDIETKALELNKLRQESYEMDTWSFSLPFGRDEKTGERYYAFPQFKVRVIYKEKKYDINVPDQKVRFIPPLSEEELKAPTLPVEAIGALAVDEKKLLLLGRAPVVTGISLLVLVFLYYAFSLFVSSKKGKEISIKEKRKNFAERADALEHNLAILEFISNNKRDGIKKQAELYFGGIQEFLNFFVADSDVDMRTKDREYLIDFVEKLPVGNNPFAGKHAMSEFKALTYLSWRIIYGDDITDEDVNNCKGSASFIAKYLCQEKKKIQKMIK